MRKFHRCTRIFILSLLVISVCVPICFLSNRIKSVHGDEPGEFIEDLSLIKYRTEAHIASALEEEESKSVKEPLMVVYKDDKFSSDSLIESNRTSESENTKNATLGESGIMQNVEEENQHSQHEEVVRNSKENAQSEPKRVQHDQSRISHSQKTSDVKLKEMKDQVIRAKVYLSFAPQGSKSHFVKEIKMRIKDLERAMGGATKDSDLSRRAVQKMKAMEATLSKASRMYPECAPIMKKLRAMTYNAEEQLRTQKNQVAFLEELAGRTTPKGLHCFSMRLTAEYFSLMPEEREFPNQHKLHNPDLYHFAVFSDNILACSVVVNSTISSAKDPEKIVFHIVTDSVSLPAISMWFLLNPPGKATIHIQSIDNIKWLSTKYDANLQQQESLDPRYTSALNHLRFYLPDIFSLLDKLVFLDHDVVVQRDLSALWRINMKGKVNGAVQTCKQGEPSYRRMDAFINFTDPMMAKRFDSETCTWAFGMNLFDLKAWRQRNLTAVYHKYLQLGTKKPLLKAAGTLPIGWITFYKHTVALNRSWHVLGLGYDSGVVRGDIEQAAVIHYDGKMKPWLDIGLEKYKPYWRKHVNYEHPHLQQCNIHT